MPLRHEITAIFCKKMTLAPLLFAVKYAGNLYFTTSEPAQVDCNFGNDGPDWILGEREGGLIG
ncbi:hypothetical protein THS27_10825 [Thalassospira sp. MCCC 1A01428]|nr:hypothetical protein THS27_10825 [Thalassospira sp. MCCC 1A01428]